MLYIRMVTDTMACLTQIILHETFRQVPLLSVTVKCAYNRMLRYLFSTKKISILRYHGLVWILIMILSDVRLHFVQFIINMRGRILVLTARSDLNYTFPDFIHSSTTWVLPRSYWKQVKFEFHYKALTFHILVQLMSSNAQRVNIHYSKKVKDQFFFFV